MSTTRSPKTEDSLKHLRITVRGPVRDLLGFFNLKLIRKKKMRRAPATPSTPGAMNLLAKRLHPETISLTIAEVRDETSYARTYRLCPTDSNPLPFFRAGQYISVLAEIDGIAITRPYSVSSSPTDALDPGFYEITIQRKKDGFFTPHIWDTWITGTPIVTSSPLGEFYYEPLRDGDRIICIAGGSGITPFKSLIPSILETTKDAKVTLFYGISDLSKVIFKSALDEMERLYDTRFEVIYVYSGAAVPAWPQETGFITREVISRYAADYLDATFFACGPEVMYHYLGNELADVATGRLRLEVPGDSRDVFAREDYRAEQDREAFTIQVRISGETRSIRARADETVLVSLERAGLAPPSRCRSGMCGFCRSKLIKGEFYAIPEGDGRRKADLKFGYFHPCSSYPLSDMELVVPQ